MPANGPWAAIIINAPPQAEQETSLLRAARARAPHTPIIMLTDAPPPEPAPPGVTHLPARTPVSEIAAALAQLVDAAPTPAAGDAPSLARRANLVEAHKTLLDRVRELDALLEIGKTVTSILDVDAILRKVVNAAVTLTDAEEGYLLLVDRTSGDLYLRAEQNLGQSQAKDLQTKMSDSIAGQVIQTGEPVFIERQPDGVKIKTGYTVRALINVPLAFAGQVIGVLGVNQRTKESFNQNDLRVMQALADWAAIAITNARLYRQAQRGSKSTELIAEISRSILSSLRMEEIPHKLIRHTTEIVGAERGSLALVDAPRGELVFQLAYDGQGQEIKRMRNLRLPLGQGIIGAVAVDGQPKIVNQARQNKLWYSSVDELTHFTTQNILAVPLKTEGQVIGVVELLNKRHADFDRNDQDLLMAVASAAAIAIQNARQFEALEKAHRDLKTAQEQRIASEQWSILGRATANLAHRIHNTTTIVPLAAQDLRDLLNQATIPPAIKADVDANLDRIERNTAFTIDLANNLLRRFHQEPAAAHNVNQAVTKALSLLRVPPTVNVVQQLAESLPAIDCSSLLVDSIVELCTNAIKAMPQGGTLAVSTACQNQAIHIKISDTGIGISAAQQEKIFNLFYGDTITGLGFGLWWVKTFLQQYGGSITVDSKEDGGSTFTIRLPLP
ncbi:MAG: GAF domain-containing protein [Anaerolineae bacterium]